MGKNEKVVEWTATERILIDRAVLRFINEDTRSETIYNTRSEIIYVLYISMTSPTTDWSGRVFKDLREEFYRREKLFRSYNGANTEGNSPISAPL